MTTPLSFMEKNSSAAMACTGNTASIMIPITARALSGNETLSDEARA
jgi:hypothetical protein